MGTAEKRLVSQPLNLNLEEIRMVNRIYAKQVRRMALAEMPHKFCGTVRTRYRRRRQFYRLLILTVWLTACTVHAAPPPPAPAVCQTPVKVMVIQGQNLDGTPVLGPETLLSPQLCACTDGTVRVCGQ